MWLYWSCVSWNMQTLKDNTHAQLWSSTWFKQVGPFSKTQEKANRRLSISNINLLSFADATNETDYFQEIPQHVRCMSHPFSKRSTPYILSWLKIRAPFRNHRFGTVVFHPSVLFSFAKPEALQEVQSRGVPLQVAQLPPVEQALQRPQLPATFGTLTRFGKWMM